MKLLNKEEKIIVLVSIRWMIHFKKQRKSWTNTSKLKIFLISKDKNTILRQYSMLRNYYFLYQSIPHLFRLTKNPVILSSIMLIIDDRICCVFLHYSELRFKAHLFSVFPEKPFNFVHIRPVSLFVKAQCITFLT